MSAATLLDRLEGVRQTGPGRWIARCPAHEDRSPSLSIREVEDGRVLIHDFAGCETLSVLHAVGLELADLFPEPLERRKPSHSSIPASDLLAIIDHEGLVVQIIGEGMVENQAVAPE